MIQNYYETEIYIRTVRGLAAIARCDEDAAVIIFQMPFMTDSFDYISNHALEILIAMGESDLDGLQRVLSHP